MSGAFASQADLEAKKESFVELANGAYALTAEGDPNSGVVVGDDAALVIDARATPKMALDLARNVATVTTVPVRHVLLSHYHAVRVLGVSGFADRINVIASKATTEMLHERGQQDMDSEIERFPRLFEAKETIPGLTWPNTIFDGKLTIDLGKREVEILQVGPGHTRGDTIAWLPREKVLYSGDLVEYGATPYCGDAQFTDWSDTLDRLASFEPERLVPGRGEALTSKSHIAEAIAGTKAYVSDVFNLAKRGVSEGRDVKWVYESAMAELRPKYGHWVIFEHCMPFNVSRAFDEAQGIMHPRIWTAQRDIEMWQSLQ